MAIDYVGANGERRHHTTWVEADSYIVVYAYYNGALSSDYTNRMYVDNLYYNFCAD